VLPGAQPAVPTWQERIPGQAWAIGGLGILALLVILVGWGLGWWSAEEPTPEVPAPTKAPAEAATEPPPEEPPPTSTAGPGLGDTWTRPADGMAMVYVPAGEFEMGSTEDSNEQPVHTVALDGFWIDRTEVTNGQYQRCVEAGDCDPPAESDSSTRDAYYSNSAYDDYPVIYVSWHQAADYCAWAGGRLPTEAEWEYAAQGPDGLIYPWGDGSPDDTLLNYGENVGDTTEVGSYPNGASWCGALDMAGNVWEWVADWYGDYPSGRQVNPAGPSSGEFRVLRGGSWSSGAYYARSASRGRNLPDLRGNYYGFRCARGSE